ERLRASDAGEAPRLAELLNGWGGVTIAYRRRLIDAPSYTLNHEEVEKALQEGIRFAEGLMPTAIEVDELGHAAALSLRRADGRAVSYFGDLHPSFAGNVVKAMGGVKQGWPEVSRALAHLNQPASSDSYEAFIARINDLLRAHVVAVNRLTPTIVEVVVRAPQAARNFHPGEFY